MKNQDFLKWVKNLIFKSGHGLIMVIIALGLVACAGSSSSNIEEGSVPLGNVPKGLVKELSNGSLRADLKVDGPDGSSAYETDLSIQTNTGEIFSDHFELPTGFTYSFIITMYYTEAGLPELAVAYVAKVAATDGDFLTVFWEDHEVLTGENQISPDLSASLSTTNLPDLDEDNDGFSNFA